MSRANPRFRRNNPKLPLPVGNVYRVKLLGQLENQLTINTFYYMDDQALATATETSIANLGVAISAAGALIPKYAACMSVDWTLTGYIIDVPTSPSLAAVVTNQLTVGSGPAGHEPTEVAAVITRQSAVKGQCGRGHVSLPAIPTSWVTASRLTTTTAHTAMATEMKSVYSFGGVQYAPAIFSRNGSHFQNGLGAAFQISTALNTLLGTVRRRKIGRGK